MPSCSRLQPYIIITYPRASLKFLIDTGAEISIVKPNVFHPNLQTNIGTKYINSLNKSSAINSSVIVPIFDEFKEQNHVRLQFIEFPFINKKFVGIIGNDILDKLDARIDFKTRTLHTRNAQIKFFFCNEEEQHELHNNYFSQIPFISYANSNPIFKHSDNINNKDACKLNHVISSYRDLFFKEGDNLTFTSEIKHRITTKDPSPVYSKSYRYPEIHREEVDRQIGEMLNQGIITPSISPYNAPLWVVPKKLDN